MSSPGAWFLDFIAPRSGVVSVGHTLRDSAIRTRISRFDALQPRVLYRPKSGALEIELAREKIRMNASTPTEAKNAVSTEIESAVDRLLDEARDTKGGERRAEPRHPFFCPVFVMPDGDRSRRFSAFAREISRSGVGLLHNMKLLPGPATLVIVSPKGARRQFSAEIVWCRPSGEGWFISGCRFVGVVPDPLT
jgi:hypothetical protein